MRINTKKKQRFSSRLWTQRELQLMVIPGAIFTIIFAYLPIYGLLMGFQEYKLGDFPGSSQWVGLKYFREFLSSPNFVKVMSNTFILSFYKLLFCFTLPILFALLLNEVRHKAYKSTVQTISYLPHFISWVVVSAITFDFLSVDGGTLNSILLSLGMISKPIMFLGKANYFRSILVITDLLKELGWSSIIYLAAISSVETSQYEAADIDGASRFQRIWHITLPSIRPTIVILLILTIGGLLNSGFEQILLLTNNLRNSMVSSVSQVLDIFTYTTGIKNGRMSYATAIGMFKSVVSVVLLLSANFVVKRLNEESLF